MTLTVVCKNCVLGGHGGHDHCAAQVVPPRSPDHFSREVFLEPWSAFVHAIVVSVIIHVQPGIRWPCTVQGFVQRFQSED